MSSPNNSRGDYTKAMLFAPVALFQTAFAALTEDLRRHRAPREKAFAFDAVFSFVTLGTGPALRHLWRKATGDPSP